MSADLPSYSSLLRTSGDMYSGVPQAVLHTEPLSSSLLYPKSHSLMMGSGMLPSSSTLSSCEQEVEYKSQATLSKNLSQPNTACELLSHPPSRSVRTGSCDDHGGGEAAS